MTKIKTTDIVAKIVEMLTPLSSEDRQRVVGAALMLVGERAIDVSPVQPAGNLKGKEEEVGSLPARARTWLKQNGLSTEQLQQVFHMTAESVEVIASDIPGKNIKEKTLNAYILTGIASLLSGSDASFGDKAARWLCEKSGSYDKNNHATYLKGRGNKFTGSKGKGWTLTAPGLKSGASLVKDLNK